MRIQKEGKIGLIVVSHNVETWLNKEHVSCITLDQHVRSMQDIMTNSDTYILGEYDVHSVILGKISTDGKYKDITFSEAYDMLEEKYDSQEYGYSHVAMFNTTNSELYLCGLEKHENVFDGKKLVWYYQWFEDVRDDTQSSFLVLSKNEHGEDTLYIISTEDIIYDDTSSSTCKMHHILGDTYMLEYESGVGEHTTMVVFNIGKKIYTEYYVDYDEDISFDVDTKEKNVIIHTEKEDVVISAEDGTSTIIKHRTKDD